MPGEPVDPVILSIPGFLGQSWNVLCQGSLWILEYLVSWDSWDHPRMSHAREACGFWNIQYPGIPGTILGCPMPGEPVDPGILSIPGFLGPFRDVPCQGSLWIPEYLVSWDSWIIQECPMPGEPVDPGILSILGFLGSSWDLVSHARGACGSWNTQYPRIPGTIPGCPM